MGNPIGSLISGVGHVIGSIFGSPFDFLSGKSCSSLCGPTWDIGCYIQNFCIEHLLKFFAVSLLVYGVLLLLYFLHKIRVYHCIGKVVWKVVWGCFSRCFYVCEYGCNLLCYMLVSGENRRRRRRRRRDIEMLDMSSRSDVDTDIESSVSYHKEGYGNMGGGRRRRWSLRDHKRNYLRTSLRARNHRVRVGVDDVTKRKHIKHGDVRVIRTSSFARRGPNHKRSRKFQKKT